MKLFKVIILACCFVSLGLAQNIPSRLLSCQSSADGLLELHISISSTSKKLLERDAQYAAIEQVLFRGCAGTNYRKPLLDMSYKAMREAYPHYSERLYTTVYTDFVRSCRAVSRLKKSGTEYIVLIDVLALKRDLLKHGLLNTLTI